MITFSINHDGDIIVLVDGKVKALAKDCNGYDLVKASLTSVKNKE